MQLPPPDIDLREQLSKLVAEHRELDQQIVALEAAPRSDQLQIKRLKKRKLALKDRIVAIEHMLDPDEYA